MPCNYVKFGSGSEMWICGGRRYRDRPCSYCGAPCKKEYLCDFPMIGKSGKVLKKSCSRLMCGRCAQFGKSPDVHFCKAHYPLALAAYERREAAKAPTLFD